MVPYIGANQFRKLLTAPSASPKTTPDKPEKVFQDGQVFVMPEISIFDEYADNTDTEVGVSVRNPQ